jgi:hypothetical protein
MRSNGRSDPFARFTLMEVDVNTSSRTTIIANSRFPGERGDGLNPGIDPFD